MLNFESFSVPNLRKVMPYIRSNPSLCSDHGAGAIFMWHSDDIRFCIWNNTFVIHQTVSGQPAFSWPVGADPDGMIDELLKYAKENHFPMRFYAVDKNLLDKITSDNRLAPARWTFDERWSDYIYSFEDAKNFKGRKFSGQRNHINKFKKLYGEPVIRLMTMADMPAINKMLQEYEQNHPPRNKLESLELSHTRRLLEVYNELELIAACLIVDGDIVAFSIGEIMNEMLLIHVEKALTRYQGIYPVMYNGFVRLVAKQINSELKLVNREDDSGDPGLRISKLQYRPIYKADKYLIHINSPADRMSEFPVIECGQIVITQMRESDKQAYLKLSTDIENNRYWGYDYREDAGITGTIDENTFYDFAMYDMKVGDSINFAIRLSENGDMIGEGILWNFTSDGSAELGCRISPDYHGNGYGKTAFGAIADYASNTLNLNVWARCFRQNNASARMITANGFTEVRSDDTFYYFEHNCNQ